ncbi:hypothetical protein Bbelb_143090 [Branchiostoma belcheri]|nr:hypothetical protein Bbelb_143090 [Branchiostoma belcheri]
MHKTFFLALLVHVGAAVTEGHGFQRSRNLKGSANKAYAVKGEIQSLQASVVVVSTRLVCKLGWEKWEKSPSGASFLRDEITAAYTDLKGKLDAAQAALEACRQTLLPEVQTGCAACVKQQCGDKAASCRPGLQGIISSLLEAALNDATGDVLEDLVGDVVYAPLVEGLAESLLPEVSNVVNDAVGTVWSGVQSVADVVVDTGEEVLNAAGEVVDAAGSLVSGVGEAVGGAINTIGDAIGGIFGGRKRVVRSEPTCADLESQGEQACLQYADSSACHASCDDMEACIQFDGSTSAHFDIKKGVKQGCVLAPTLFSIYFAALLRFAFDGSHDGIYIRSRTDGSLFNLARLRAKTKTVESLLRDLLFADDAALVSHKEAGLQGHINNLAKACDLFSLTISVKKTEVMGQGTTVPPVIMLNGNALKSVEKFTYLGSVMTNNLSLDQELNVRIGKAAAAYGKLTKRDVCRSTLKDFYIQEKTWEQLAVDRNRWRAAVTNCRTFNTAVRTMEISKQQHGWVTNLPQQQQDYIVRQVTVDTTNAGTAGYVPSAEVKVTIFGDNYTLPMSPPPWDYSLEGRRIAEQALNIFKRRHPYTSN